MQNTPYLNKEGKLFVGNRPASMEELEAFNATFAAPQTQGETPLGLGVQPGVAPRTEPDLITQARLRAEEQRRFGRNPIGAGLGFLMGDPQ